MQLNAKRFPLNASRGFTLLEILVAVTIVAILSSIIIVGLSQIQARGRDTRRIKDLSETQHALELYYSANGSYPAAATWGGLRTALLGSGSGNNLGIISIPSDPSPSAGYGYCAASDGSRYVLAAYLEDTNNPNLRQYPSETNFDQICRPTTVPEDSRGCSKSGNLTHKYCLAF
ncbi:prepilin-type N-terminal cleavage/methylation domain-containing protein [Candidatus Wolfebacteria bacterium]|nr:prepilin-type N-terminal cleavage/methylation domain-containing protein [Candidatus Wolfebacteria bacterium]